MTRTALIALSIATVLLAGIAHVNASGKQASDATIVELEARIAALESRVLPEAVPLIQGDFSCETDWCIPEDSMFRMWCDSAWIRPIEQPPTGPPISQDYSRCALISEVTFADQVDSSP